MCGGGDYSLCVRGIHRVDSGLFYGVVASWNSCGPRVRGEFSKYASDYRGHSFVEEWNSYDTN